MNSDQRKFLNAQVTKTFEKQRDELKRRIPVKPSLNNYLIAAFLDNTIKFADLDALKEMIRAHVIRMGTDERLLERSNNSWSHRSRTKDDDEPLYIKIPPEFIFEIPTAYSDALAKYNAERSGIEEKLERLEAALETITMKINIGSNTVLDRLVTQVDNMADLNIMNSQLLISGGGEK